MRKAQRADKLVLCGSIVLLLIGCSKHVPVAPVTATPEWPDLAGFTAEPLEAPDSVAFLETAPTLEELIAKTRPDLVWLPDRYGVFQSSPMFLWTERSHGCDSRVFILDRAYPISKNGRQFWAFLDPASSEYSDLLVRCPVFVFFCQTSFFREVLTLPYGCRHDGNYSFVEELSRRDDGSLVFKLVYCGLSGKPGAEETQTYIVYIDPNGKCQLASRNLGQHGTSKVGSDCYNDSIETEVVWHGPGLDTPFHVKIRKVEVISEIHQYYRAFEDGQLRGPFPMTLQTTGLRYVEGDDKLTFASLAEDFTRFNGPGPYVAGVTSGIRIAILGSWEAELIRLNPGLPTDKPIAQGQRIIIPDERRFGRMLLNVYANRGL